MKDSLGEFFVVLSLISFMAAIVYSHYESVHSTAVDTLQPMGWSLVIWHGYSLFMAIAGLCLLIGEYRAHERQNPTQA